MFDFKVTDSMLSKLSIDKLLDSVGNLGDLQEDDIKTLVYEMSANLLAIYKRSKEEVKGLLTKEEAYLICDALNSTLYSEEIPVKTHILLNVTDGIYYEDLDKKWNVDAKILINKLNGISEMQAYVIMVLVNEFWHRAIENLYVKVEDIFCIR